MILMLQKNRKRKIGEYVNSKSLLVLFFAISLFASIYLANREVRLFSSAYITKSTPEIEATKTTYDIPVAIIMFLPDEDKDGIIDYDTTQYKGYYDDISNIRYSTSVDDLEKKILKEAKDGAKFLGEASKYKGYKDKNAVASLNYDILENHIYKIYENPTNWYRYGNETKYVDYYKYLTKYNICDLVKNEGVKEVWMWTQHTDDIAPVESNLSSNFGDISNSSRYRDDLPICSKSYILYNYNFTRGLGEFIHNHGHQLEALYNQWPSRNATSMDKRKDLLYWGKWVGADDRKIVRPGCGWIHFPPNNPMTSKDYDYWKNTYERESDCEDWKPDGTGDKKIISCSTWTNYYYGTKTCGGLKTELAFYKWWMQNIPGYGNDLYHNGKKLRNWWDYIGDLDSVYKNKGFLYLSDDEILELYEKAQIIEPSNNSYISNDTETVKWTKGESVKNYVLKVGKTKGGNEYGEATSIFTYYKFNVPQNTKIIYVTLVSVFSNDTKAYDYKTYYINNPNLIDTELTLRLKGTTYNQRYPHAKVYVNDSLFREIYVTSSYYKDYKFSYLAKREDIKSVYVEFTDDASGGGADRNLYVDYIMVGDDKYQAEDRTRVKYDRGFPWDKSSRFDGQDMINAREDMLWSGTLKFDIQKGQVTNRTSIILKSRGTSYQNGYPTANIYVNNVLIGTKKVNNTSYQELGTIVNVKREDIKSVYIEFTNDASGGGADRNLYVDYIMVGDDRYQAEDRSRAKYDRGLPWDRASRFDGQDMINTREDMLWSGTLKFNVT